MSEFTFIKDNVEIYRVRGNHTWADFVIDDRGEGKGQILINSDYGSWSYYWGSMGPRGIKAFLVDADDSYLMGKFSGARTWFDEEATKVEMRKVLDDELNGGYMDKDTYDELMEEIDDGDYGNADRLYASMSDKMSDLFPDMPPMITDHEPGLRNFMKVLFSEFRNILKDEIKSNIPV